MAWWAACLGVWLISLSAFSYQEFVLALVVSLPCGICAAGARRLAGDSWSWRAASLAPVLRFPLALCSDTVRVLSMPLRGRRPEGAFETVTLASSAGTGSVAAGQRAFATWLISATPGTFVVELRPDDGESLVHVLTDKGPRMEQALAERA